MISLTCDVLYTIMTINYIALLGELIWAESALGADPLTCTQVMLQQGSECAWFRSHIRGCFFVPIFVVNP